MRIMVAMSGGVDSSVAAALALEAGHEVVGATLKLWGGASDSGCCSVADVEDARRVAHQLGIDHHVFNLTEEFAEHVVAPYVEAHQGGRTPNPCIECNRHIKFDLLLSRATRLGFDALCTGHHARIRMDASGQAQLWRGVDPAKDQSYVLSMLSQAQLARLWLPVGEMTKSEVRTRAGALGLRTAGKPDSQDVCFIHSDGGRGAFIGQRADLHPGVIVDRAGRQVGEVAAVELVTVGQRRGLGHDSGRRRYAVAVDIAARRVVVAPGDEAMVRAVNLEPSSLVSTGAVLTAGRSVVAQVSAHGRPAPADLRIGPAGVVVEFVQPQRPVAPGQTIAFYDIDSPDRVVGCAIAS